MFRHNAHLPAGLARGHCAGCRRWCLADHASLDRHFLAAAHHGDRFSPDHGDVGFGLRATTNRHAIGRYAGVVAADACHSRAVGHFRRFGGGLGARVRGRRCHRLGRGFLDRHDRSGGRFCGLYRLGCDHNRLGGRFRHTAGFLNRRRCFDGGFGNTGRGRFCHRFLFGRFCLGLDGGFRRLCGRDYRYVGGLGRGGRRRFGLGESRLIATENLTVAGHPRNPVYQPVDTGTDIDAAAAVDVLFPFVGRWREFGGNFGLSQRFCLGRLLICDQSEGCGDHGDRNSSRNLHVLPPQDVGVRCMIVRPE